MNILSNTILIDRCIIKKISFRDFADDFLKEIAKAARIPYKYIEIDRKEYSIATEILTESYKIYVERNY